MYFHSRNPIVTVGASEIQLNQTCEKDTFLLTFFFLIQSNEKYIFTKINLNYQKCGLMCFPINRPDWLWWKCSDLQFITKFTVAVCQRKNFYLFFLLFFISLDKAQIFLKNTHLVFSSLFRNRAMCGNVIFFALYQSKVKIFIFFLFFFSLTLSYARERTLKIRLHYVRILSYARNKLAREHHCFFTKCMFHNCCMTNHKSPRKRFDTLSSKNCSLIRINSRSV